MNKNTIFKIICDIIAIGVNIGIFLFGSKHSGDYYQQSEYERNQKEYIAEQKNASDASYQVNEAYWSIMRLRESAGVKDSRFSYSQKMKEAKENLSYWIDVRENELREEMSRAKETGDDKKIEQCQQELEKLNEKKQVLYDD